MPSKSVGKNHQNCANCRRRIPFSRPLCMDCFEALPLASALRLTRAILPYLDVKATLKYNPHIVPFNYPALEQQYYADVNAAVRELRESGFIPPGKAPVQLPPLQSSGPCSGAGGDVRR